MTNEIYHHGVKGQQWGVRNGPPYPIEDKVYKKGSKVNSVSLDKKQNKKQAIYVYNKDDAWDNKVYKGAFSKYLLMYRSKMYRSKGQKFVYEHQYELTRDLKMPTSQERIDAFINIYKNDKINTVDELNSVQEFLTEVNVGTTEAKTVNVSDLKTKKDYLAAYEVFNHAMENASAFRMTQKYMDFMQKNYDAMVDDNNVNVYNNAHDPVVIFATDALKDIGKVKIKKAEVNDNFNKLSEELSKEGKRVKL